jgi:hypothetical protein
MPISADAPIRPCQIAETFRSVTTNGSAEPIPPST